MDDLQRKKLEDPEYKSAYIKSIMHLSYHMVFVEDFDEGGFSVDFPELPGCITCGDTIEDAYNNARDAQRAWLTTCLNDGLDIPVPKPSGADMTIKAVSDAQKGVSMSKRYQTVNDMIKDLDAGV